MAQAMETLGIPVRTKHPFGADWLSIGDRLSKVRPQAASWLVSLVYEAWAIAFWNYSVAEKGYIHEIVMGFLLRMKGQDPCQRATSMRDFDKKWWLDALSLLVRAVWDKLPIAIAESSTTPIKITSPKHAGRLNELEENKNKLQLDEKGHAILDRLLAKARNIEAVKDHRDDILHRHTVRYLEVLGLEEKGHKTLGEVWAILKPEMDRGLEALLTTIGIILLEAQIITLQ